MAKHDLINPSVSHHCGTEQSPPSLPTMQSCPSQRCAVWPSNFRGFGPKGIDNSPRNIYMSAAPRSAFALNIPVQITCQCSVSVQSPVACSRSFPRPVPHSRHSHYSFLLPSALDEPHFASSASCISVATLLLLLATVYTTARCRLALTFVQLLPATGLHAQSYRFYLSSWHPTLRLFLCFRATTSVNLSDQARSSDKTFIFQVRHQCGKHVEKNKIARINVNNGHHQRVIFVISCLIVPSALHAWIHRIIERSEQCKKKIFLADTMSFLAVHSQYPPSSNPWCPFRPCSITGTMTLPPISTAGFRQFLPLPPPSFLVST
jgi:hypothetical protein